MKPPSTARNQTHKLDRPTTRRRPAGLDTKPKVLIVDDEPAVLRGLRKLLEDRWHVETAVGACTAASMLHGSEYEAIVTDYDMPGRDGLWLLDYVRNQFPTMKRVMLSGSEPFIFSPHLQSGLIQECLHKPTTADRLADSLE